MTIEGKITRRNSPRFELGTTARARVLTSDYDDEPAIERLVHALFGRGAQERGRSTIAPRLIEITATDRRGWVLGTALISL